MELELPTINIAPFLDRHSFSTSSRKTCAAAIHSACLHSGFFYITGFESLLSPVELERVLSLSRDFFNRPAEEKRALRIRQPDGARGYQVLGENVTQYKADHHEAIDIYKPLGAELEDSMKLLHGPNQWPLVPESFRPAFEEWVEKAKVLGMAVMEAAAMGLGIDLEGEEWQRLRGTVDDSFWVLRVIGYPPLPPDAPGVSCGSHRDYGFWTLLHSDSTQEALQVFLPTPPGSSTDDGGNKGEWINANPKPNTFIVNIGEAWEVLSNGLYRATLHRVLHKGENFRVSIPFFFEPNWDAVIEPLPSALRIQRESGKPLPELKKSFHYGEFLSKKVSGNFAAVES